MVSSPMRIAYIEATANMGGAEHALGAILTHFPPELVEPVLICPSPGTLTKWAKELGISTLIVPLPQFISTSTVIGNRKIFNPFNSFYDVAAIWSSAYQLRKVLLKHRIALVHTNTMFAHFYGSIAARLAGIPSVWHVHDFIETARFGGGAGLFFRWVAHLPNFLIAVSEAVRKAFLSLPGDSIYIGVDLDEIDQDRKSQLGFSLSVTEAIPVVSYIGRIAFSKGTDIFIRAAHQVIQENRQVCFVIVGESSGGETKYYQEILCLVKTLGLENHVILTGYQKQVMPLMENSDIIVLPSRRESFGRVLIEAGAMSKPVIASNVGGIPEIVENGETGFLVSPENPSQLADAIKYLLNNRELAKQMGTNARSLIESKFTIGHTVTRILDVYSHVLLSQSQDSFRS